MNETSLTYFYDALIASRAIQTFCSKHSFDDYCSNDLLSSAEERKFEIIGEALNQVKRTAPEDLSAISDWPAIIGFRNILAHNLRSCRRGSHLGYCAAADSQIHTGVRRHPRYRRLMLTA
ncbi:hypothetical protein SH580_04545 [Coraliomargarita algicola]|uniref:DUF86 domain-containing protein n=1 Tax=Coraliomargarita algicola TaxID=3092156 RepID=A0ABZ0RNI2_9BACT|nr:HepT-like ribonuclease domain-containing protein [Coraliomargarita sp. J2-16]WPJ96976.1 hypothetical protein SH580_04545 [Coraliomargarita sp. J2-16]